MKRSLVCDELAGLSSISMIDLASRVNVADIFAATKEDWSLLTSVHAERTNPAGRVSSQHTSRHWNVIAVV